MESMSDARNFYVAPNLSKFHSAYRSAMESEVVDFSKKMVMVGWSNIIETELKYMNKLYPGIQFFTGATSAGIQSQSWQFEDLTNSEVPSVLVRLTRKRR